MSIKDARLALSVGYDATSLGEQAEDADELLKKASLALWLAGPVPAGITAILHFEDASDQRILRSSGWGSSLCHHSRDKQNFLSAENLTLARRLHESLLALPPDGTMQTTVSVLWRALVDQWWQSRYLGLWVAMESLFGPENPQEVTYRISNRCAALLARDKQEALQIAEATREGYGWRSKVVHGHRLKKLTSEVSEQLSHDVEGFLRRALVKALVDRATLQSIDGKGRDKYLDALLFDAPWMTT